MGETKRGEQKEREEGAHEHPRRDETTKQKINISSLMDCKVLFFRIGDKTRYKTNKRREGGR